VLYLAEVKKQTKGFIKGFKTELKLLACQHSDQTWSPIPGDEVLISDALEQPTGEGVLIMLNLNQTRQIQDKPELASPELVRQLQKLSRLSEKIKDQREEVEKWKQSLTIQFKELSRREMEIDSRQEQMEAMVEELSQIEQYRQEVSSIREQIAKEQQKIAQFTSQFGDLVDLPAEQLALFPQWVSRQSQDLSSGSESNGLIVAALTVFSQQQNLLNRYGQDIADQRSLLDQRRQHLEQKESLLKNQREALSIAQKSLEEARINIEVQKNLLVSKQEWLKQLNLMLQANEDLKIAITRLAVERVDDTGNHQQALEALDDLPLGELETKVNQLKAELDKFIQFVNDQEEELTGQSQAVQELEAKLAIANEYDRLPIESELAEERERKNMLDETLVGQRRNLKERQKIFLQYLRVLRRRQGIIDPDERFATLDWEAVFNQIQDARSNLEEERHNLEAEIEALQESLGQCQGMIEETQGENQQKRQENNQEEENCLQLKVEIQQLQSFVQIFEDILQPLQSQSDEILSKLEELQKILSI
jgi:hypothetical protein